MVWGLQNYIIAHRSLLFVDVLAWNVGDKLTGPLENLISKLLCICLQISLRCNLNVVLAIFQGGNPNCHSFALEFAVVLQQLFVYACVEFDPA